MYELKDIEVKGVEIALNRNFAGAVLPARRIADLYYGVALPAPWQSRVEPAEYHQAGMVAAQPGVLRISGSKDTQVFQWVELKNHKFARAQVNVRGKVSTSGVVMITLGWLDNQQRHLGTTTMRLPEGEWSEWVTLTQADNVPVNAAWVGVGFRVQDQAKDDWVEACDFSLRTL
jgi:hypothetical protein